ncbi:hypothetical protein CEXT_708921 [Caerostris extrusa]|uniref:U1-type domain-containing protein n=1 Tax=Caerostris extrusa TaxID=172846 RepID=A0AAV4VLB0_CAEEX|nr:hypothetical protein CEXT_708921 [Caerostris extrusa]
MIKDFVDSFSTHVLEVQSLLFADDLVSDSGVEVVDESLKYVCEIRRDGEIVYFCSLCQSACGTVQIMSHLTGYKHRVSYFGNGKIFRQSAKRRKKLKSLRKFLQNVKMNLELASNQDLGEIKNYRHPKKKIFVIEKEDPNTMFSDFYCNLCDAHMNNRIMWESHIVGKRHLKNQKKLYDGNMDLGSKLKLAPEGTLFPFK